MVPNTPVSLPVEMNSPVNKSLEDKESSGTDKPQKKETSSRKLITWLIGLIAIASIGLGAFYFYQNFTGKTAKPSDKPQASLTPIISKDFNISKFESEEEFLAYLEEADSLSSAGFFGTSFATRDLNFAMEEGSLEEMAIKAPTAGGGEAQRVSETNVQVKGIDEPDIVKTDGKKIYYSPDFYRGWVEPVPMPDPIIMERSEQAVDSKAVISPEQTKIETKIINAFPPSDLIKEGVIDKTGELLLKDNILVVFGNNNVYGFDVTVPSQPTQKWDVELKDRNYIVSSRLYNDKIYLVVSSYIQRNRPCPFEPVLFNGKAIQVGCMDVYHPQIPVPTDVTYTAIVIDSNSGNVEKQVSFVGSTGSSVIYMSKDFLYTTYSYYEDTMKFLYNFYASMAKDLISTQAFDKLKKLQDYDISNQAKLLEMQTIIQEYQDSLDDDERLRIENEFTNRLENYTKEHRRELEQTGIVKIKLSGFEIAATGNIPGRPLNQFSLDEYKGNLRIATTIGQVFGRSESANDVYVLDSNLKVLSTVIDLGLEERIYSVRFIEDKGYLVTFRQIDPFYVLDLSDPNNARLAGELKIPGYSSYLHPISKDLILGIGEEDNKVKVALFNVSNPVNPLEQDKYILDDYWSEISNTHHAFLLDDKHEVFFLPGSKGGYIFSYKQDKLAMVRAVSGISAKRALYLDDYLYIVGNLKIVVLNEADWQEVNSLEF